MSGAGTRGGIPWEAVAAHLNEGILWVDADNRVTFANTKAARLLRPRAGRLVGRAVRGAFPSPGRENLTTLLKQARVTATPIHGQLTVHERELSITIVPLRRGRRNPGDLCLLLGSDGPADPARIHATLLARERLASVGQLVAGIAHELNNPMATIASCAEALLTRLPELCRQDVFTEDNVALYLKIIEDEVYRCKAVLAGLSDLCRETEQEVRPINVAVLMEGLATLLSYQLRARGIALKQRARGACLAPGQEGELRQVGLHLLANAIEAMEKGGTLTVDVARRGRSVTIAVQDTGPGIPPSVIPRVFEPFFTTKPAGKGAGLGLYVAREIIEAHGGRIHIQSRPGKGTCVRVIVPAADTAR
ncbi:MAG: nitrogen regulation protein NR(II) [Candidatus Methylomirabilales bacterium]